LALAELRFNRNPRNWYLPVAIVAIGAGACGERLPLLAVVAIVAWAIWQATGTRRERTGRDPKKAVFFGALSFAGVIAGSLIATYSSASGSLQRAAASSSEETFGQRFMAWRQGLRAFTHHFLLGAGPGQFRSVTTALFPLSFMRAAPTTVFTDAHDIFVEYLVTTGLLGILALLAWLLVTLYRARGPLVLAALVLLAIELAEPLNVAVTPVAFCALGAAICSPRIRAARTARGASTANAASTGDTAGFATTENAPENPHPFPVALRAIIGAFALAGLVAGALFFVGDGLLTRSESQYDLAQDQPALQNATTANDILRAWPDPASEIGEIHFYLGLGDHPAQRDLAVVWAKVAALRDPTNSPSWVTLADYQLAAGQYAGAQQSAAQAIIYLPWYPAALNDLGIASLALGQNAAAHKWFERSLEITPDQPPIRAFYDGNCKLQRTQIGLSLLTKHCASGGGS
jgi:hypothetical protein